MRTEYVMKVQGHEFNRWRKFEDGVPVDTWSLHDYRGGYVLTVRLQEVHPKYVTCSVSVKAVNDRVKFRGVTMEGIGRGWSDALRTVWKHMSKEERKRWGFEL
jgi:hypothetical protein